LTDEPETERLETLHNDAQPMQFDTYIAWSGYSVLTRVQVANYVDDGLIS